MKKTMSRLFTAVLMVMLLCSLTVMSVSAAETSDTHVHPGDGWTPITNETTSTAAQWSADIKQGGKYYLSENLNTNQLAFGATEDVILCLNGKTLSATEDSPLYVVSGNVTLCNCVAETGGIYGGSGRSVTLGGTLTMDDTVTIGGPNQTAKTGVQVNTGGTLIMEGGTISHAQGGAAGGGVLLNGGSMVMEGGKITTNKATQGAGVCINNSNSTFTMRSGTISDNVATSFAGGVKVSGTFNMEGGAITDNQAPFGGGMYVSGKGTANLSGTATISSNDALSTNLGGGGVFVEGGTLNLSGTADITGNTATSNGGGVSNFGGTFSMTDDSTISGNTAANGGGVYAQGTSFVTLTGGSIYDKNIATTSGGGIYLASGTSAEMKDGFVLAGNQAQTKVGGGAYVASGASFTLSGGTIGGTAIGWNLASLSKSSGNNAMHDGAGVYNEGTFTMDGGTITGNKGNSSGAGVYNSGTFTLNKGTIKSNMCGGTSAADGVHIASGSFTMVDGTIDATSPTANNNYLEAVRLSGGTANIRGGTILAIDTALTAAGGTAAVSGGSFDGALAETTEDTIAISGGKFSGDTERSVLAGFLNDTAANLSLLPIDENGLIYEAGTGYVRSGEFMDFQSSLDLTITLGADVGFTAEGVTATVNDRNVDYNVVDTFIVIPISGITAKQMHDEFAVKVVSGSDTLYSETLSVYSLAEEWYNDDATDAAKTMLADMINYGIAAQNEFKYNTDDDAALEGGTTTEPTWTASGEASVEGTDASNVAVSLLLKERIELKIYVKDDGAAEGHASMTIDNIAVKDAKKTQTVTITLSDNSTVTVKYSIADYVVAALADSANTQKDLLVALQKYVDSVSKYLN